MAQAQTSAAPGKTKAAPRASRAKKPQAEQVVQTTGNATGPGGKNMPEVTAQNQNPPEITQEQRQGERRQQQQSAIARFANQSMDTPAAHNVPEVTDEQRKLIAFQEQMRITAEQFGVQLPPNLEDVLNGKVEQPQAQGAQGAQRAPRNADSQNGVTRPAKGTKTGQVWDAADAISTSKNGQPATIAEVKEKLAGSVNDATTRTQYSRWRNYHGIKGRLDAQPQQQQAASPEGRDEGIEKAFGRRKDDVDRRQAEPAAQ